MGQAKEIFENSVTGLAGSVTGAIGNELGYAIGNLTGSNQRRADEQYKQQERLTGMQAAYQSDLMKESYGLQKGMWDATNYEAQVEHAKNAGLNPAMLYAKGGAGGSTGSGGASVGGASASDESSRQAAQTQQSGMGLQLEMMKSQIEVNKSIAAKNTAEASYTGGAQTELAEAQIGELSAKIDNIANLTKSETIKQEGYKADNILKGLETSLREGTLSASIALATEQVNVAKTSIEKMLTDMRKTNVEASILEQAESDIVKTYNQTLKNLIVEGLLKNKEIQVKQEQIYNLVMDRVLNKIDTMSMVNYRELQVQLQQQEQYLRRELTEMGLEQSEINALIGGIMTITGASLLKGSVGGHNPQKEFEEWNKRNPGR